MESLKNIISANTDVLGGLPVFTGTRVPVETLFFHIEKGITIDEFLEDFPSVSKIQVVSVLEVANKLLTSDHIDKIYEIAS
ncbi:Uncharacterized conserved protein, DUF433 family [Pedobacter suwonensis]|uniref:Uncharacterized conserved protein, DUF433 family n=1 Tax=Pedobacter suwonensis TaxID=332999 RepID=A0A1I0SHE1_9SPHI|nr:DUF433 domain-containing protein [Pedobacter suwonensis]SFA38935.1 Uncharacterized conserved protein, DUF433 family [Pedobacter suwonensis]